MMYNLRTLLRSLYDACLKSKVSNNIYFKMPKHTVGVSDYVVIVFPNEIRSLWAYGKTSCRIMLCAKDRESGDVNHKKLGEMQDSIGKVLPIDDGVLVAKNPRCLDLGSNDFGFHVWAIILDVRIN